MECAESGKAAVNNRKKPKIETFGYFNLFVDNVPVVFSNSKEKEMLACLVEHNGGPVDDTAIMNCIFDGVRNEPSQQVIFRRTKKSLSQTCQSYGISHILLNKNRTMSILRNEVDCDFFSFNDGDERSIFRYSGEYMRDFSWAETTQADLDRRQLRYFVYELNHLGGPQTVADFLKIIGYDPYS